MRFAAAALVVVSVLAVSRAASAAEEGLVLGVSLEGRRILAVRFSLPGDVDPGARPRLLVVAGLNPDHRAGIAVAERLGARLLALAAEDEALAALLRRLAVEIVTVANPDGRAALEEGPRRDGRLNARPVDRDRDGLTDEDGPDDLDGDGRILTMRVRDAAGGWRVSDEDPRLMVRAAPGEAGGWRVLAEGIDDDGDGELGEDGPGGVDLDRNFAHGWNEHDPDTGRSCPSEKASRALIDHVLAHRGIAGVLVLGRRDNLSKTPDANRAKGPVAPDGPLGDDRPWWDDVAKAHRAIVGRGPEADDRADGAFHQWAYYQHGIPAFASRAWYREDPEDAPPLPSGKKPTTEDGKWLAWSDRELEGRGFVAWKPFTHPQLGPVEIGGFVPGLRTDPPEALLDDLTDRMARFAKDLLGRFPRMVLADAKAEALGGGLAEVTATLVSEGDFPVISEMGQRTRAVMPVRVTIDTPREAILQGRALEKIDRLGRRGDRRRLRWVVRSEGPIRIRAVSGKAGTVETEVKP